MVEARIEGLIDELIDAVARSTPEAVAFGGAQVKSSNAMRLTEAFGAAFAARPRHSYGVIEHYVFDRLADWGASTVWALVAAKKA